MSKKKKKYTLTEIRREVRKYNSRIEFQKNSPKEYRFARYHKILDKVCSHMVPKYKKWTKKELIEEARKYKTRMEFKRKNLSAYRAASKLKIRDKVCSHMESGSKWTNEKIREEAKKYNYKIDFRKNSPTAYQRSLSKGKRFHTKTCIHMLSRYKKWTKKTLKEEAKKYNTRTAFKKGSISAYREASKRKILDEICSHMKQRNRWTFKKLKNEALKYNTKKAFREGNPNAYATAYRLKLIDKICSHMRPLGNLSKRSLYAFVFPDKSVYVGLTCDYNRRYKQHMKKSKIIIKKTKLLGHEFIMFNKFYDEKKVGKKEAELINYYKKLGYFILNKHKAGSLGSKSTHKWTAEKIKKEAKKYKQKYQFKKESPQAYSASVRKGKSFHNETCSHMSLQKKWTKKEVEEEAKKYQYKNDFRLNAGSAYNAARRFGILDKVCKHMFSKYKKWTQKEIEKEAKKYQYRYDFQKYSSKAYSAARRLKIVNEVCKHMKRKSRRK